MPCRICNPLPCTNPSDLATGVDGAFYSALDFSFIVQCPPHCVCPAGLFPQTISILASTIPPVIPPINEPGEQIILRLQGCTSLITRTLADGSTQSEIAAASQSMQAEWAGQQALCNALLEPGVNCNTGESITVCNDASTFVCPSSGLTCTIDAGTRCSTLVTTGLTEAQIAAATAQLKARLNDLATSSCCPFLHIFCESTITFSGVGDVTTVTLKNFGSVAFDSSSIQLCNSGGAGCQNSVVPSVNPGVTANLISLSPYLIAFTIKYQGVVIFSGPAFGPGTSRFINLQVQCNGP